MLLNNAETEGLDALKYEKIFKKFHRNRDASLPCYTISKINENPCQYQINTGYFVGVDWLVEGQVALYVAPKLNSNALEIDFSKMLFSALSRIDVSKEIDELFEVKWKEPSIEISQKQDLLTPFLVVEFLSLLKIIVRKGLKKSYYKVEQNLNSRVKGKVLVGKSIKKNLMQNKPLYTYCSYDEFGINHKENRLLKKALVFVKQYLPNYSEVVKNKDLQNVFNYINPAFETVTDKIELSDIKQIKSNALYKEYPHALHLAKLILKRFGYNISNTVKEKIVTPPFWIDMSKLFELYVLGLLKDRFGKDVQFQFGKNTGNELDYLLNSLNYQMVIDAKYKLKYLNGKYDEDIRQVSGYARLKKVYEELSKIRGQVIDCLIIYPDQENGVEDLLGIDLKAKSIEQYYDVYKLGVKLPLIK